MNYDDSETRDMLMSAANIKSEPEWDTVFDSQSHIPIDVSGMDFSSVQVTYSDAILRTLFPTQDFSALEGKHPSSTGASFAERRRNEFVELEQALARANDERKELEVQVAQCVAKAKSCEEMLVQLRDNNHNDDRVFDAVDSDLKTSNGCSFPDHIEMREACPPAGALLLQQQKGYVKVSPFWLSQNLELDETGCLWWEMS
ncbi:hypothetical protein MMC17_005138 [Xylographa soralifera]|nr:hypothetical protein [Xylographa soralifera]